MLIMFLVLSLFPISFFSFSMYELNVYLAILPWIILVTGLFIQYRVNQGKINSLSYFLLSITKLADTIFSLAGIILFFEFVFN
jgi:nucleoside permease NupC